MVILYTTDGVVNLTTNVVRCIVDYQMGSKNDHDVVIFWPRKIKSVPCVYTEDWKGWGGGRGRRLGGGMEKVDGYREWACVLHKFTGPSHAPPPPHPENPSYTTGAGFSSADYFRRWTRFRSLIALLHLKMKAECLIDREDCWWLWHDMEAAYGPLYRAESSFRAGYTVLNS